MNSLMISDYEFSKSIHSNLKEIVLCCHIDREFLSTSLLTGKYKMSNEKFTNLKNVEYRLSNFSKLSANHFYHLAQDKVSVSSNKVENGYFIKRNATVYYAKDGKLQSFKCKKLHSYIYMDYEGTQDYIIIPVNNNLNFFEIFENSSNFCESAFDFYSQYKLLLDGKLTFFTENRGITEL
jgi:hypothetical protein